jgi:O-antigen ligase
MSRLLGAALVWLVVSYGIRALESPNVLAGLQTWVDGILLPVVLYAAVRHVAETERDCRRIAGALAACGLVLAAIGLASKVMGFELASLSGGTPRLDTSIGVIRISGPYDVPEPYALSLLVCLAGTLYWAQLRRAGGLWVGCGIAAIELAAIGLTFFRAAWIGAIVVVAAAFGLRPKRALRAFVVLALVGGAVLAGALAFGDNETIATRVNDTANVYARVATYLQGLEIFREAPLAGVGVNEFVHAQADHFGAAVVGVGALEHPHSTYVSMLAEQGLLGFIPLLAATLAGWLVIRRLRRSAATRGDVLLAAAAVGAGFSYLIMSLSLTMLPFGPSNALFVIVLGMAASRLDAITGRREPRE